MHLLNSRFGAEADSNGTLQFKNEIEKVMWTTLLGLSVFCIFVFVQLYTSYVPRPHNKNESLLYHPLSDVLRVPSRQMLRVNFGVVGWGVAVTCAATTYKVEV